METEAPNGTRAHSQTANAWQHAHVGPRIYTNLYSTHNNRSTVPTNAHDTRLPNTALRRHGAATRRPARARRLLLGLLAPAGAEPRQPSRWRRLYTIAVVQCRTFTRFITVYDYQLFRAAKRIAARPTDPRRTEHGRCARASCTT